MDSLVIKVLLIEDDEDDFFLLKSLLREIVGVKYKLEWVTTYEEGIAKIANQVHDVYLVDYQLGARSGIELITEATARGAEKPIILLTGAGDREVDLEAMQAGAVDFLTKEKLDADSLERSIRYAIQHKRLEDERKRRIYAQIARMQAEARELEYRTLAETIPQIIWSADKEGKVDYFNRRWYEYTGLDALADADAGWWESVHAEDKEMTKSRWAESVESGLAYEVEYRIRRADGAYRWYLVRAVPVFDSKDMVIKWFGTCTDIEDQKEQARQKDEFISIASHELKTPITAVRVYSELLEKYFKSMGDDKRRSYTEKVIKHADRLTRLVDDLLDVNKLAANKVQIRKEPFESDDFVREVIEDLQSMIYTHEIKLTCKADCVVEADRFRLGQILNNLVMNAVKYSPNSEVIHVRSLCEGNWLVLEVEDFGVGMPKEAITQIFKQFYRIEYPGKAKTEGLGLGLFISNEIAKLHGGGIDVMSELGKGSVFRVKLPVKNS